MTTFLERYLAGSYREVWTELTALGASVRQEPVASDALAVARETMRRTRRNIEQLIERLRALGYQFGYEWWDPDAQFMLEVDPPPPIYAPPQSDARVQLAALEVRVGLIPLSLRAWYEYVGAVNLVGMYPVEDSTDPEGFTGYVQWKRSIGNQQGRQASVGFIDHDLDPLYIDGLDTALRHLDITLSHGYVCEIDLAPDEWLKYGVSGGGPYSITLPNPAADALVGGAEWHRTTFVDYLRTCFMWGGFPGLACKTRRPEKELAFLTRDLLPI